VNAETIYYFMFYFTAAIAVFATLMMITRHNAVHALLYLIISSLSMAIIFYLLGAPFAAALEVIIYAGAVMILFVFVVMMLNLGHRSVEQEAAWMPAKGWIVPGILAAVLLIMLVAGLGESDNLRGVHLVGAKEVGIELFGPYLLVVELASFLLMAGLVGAFHLARRTTPTPQYGDKEASL
jgi:NADH-quinone oxidoreductase subunit J